MNPLISISLDLNLVLIIFMCHIVTTFQVYREARCQTLSKALLVSQITDLTSLPWSRDFQNMSTK